MNEITEALYAEKVRTMAAEIEGLRSVVTVLVFHQGNGRNIEISKGRINEAKARVESIDYRELSNGTMRFNVKTKEKDK